MWQNPQQRHHFKLHYCEQDNHYHFLLGPENISWPFWSLEAALKMIILHEKLFTNDFLKGEIGPDELAFGRGELERLREEIMARSQIRGTDQEYLMPRNLLRREIDIARFWREFLVETKPYIFCVHEAFTDSFVKPLYCDFVHREQPKPESALRDEWETLAYKPVTRLRMEDLGIMLEPLAE